VTLPPFAVEALRRHRKDQAERRLLPGKAWQGDYFFDRGDGRPWEPGELSHAFMRAAKRAGVPGTRLHDLSHGFATTLLASGVHPKVASEALGHSTTAITLDVYSHVLPSMGDVCGPGSRSGARTDRYRLKLWSKRGQTPVRDS
jgi:integrase